MTRSIGIALAGVVAAVLGIAPAAVSAPKQKCVGGPGCYATLQAALAAATDGDTVRLGPGSYDGGVTITKSIDLVGAGASVTTIHGGGPVVTIGVYLAPTEPTVSISGVTITGGLTTSSFGSPARAEGGGVQIPPNAACDGGATVTISDSVISGNTASASGSDPALHAPCPRSANDPAIAGGGGIYNAGQLTLENTTVTGNTAGGLVTSNAWGGGILSRPSSTLTIDGSSVSGNQAVASDPDGIQATGGGILFQSNGLMVRHSVVNGNRATLTSTKSDVAGTFQVNSAAIQSDGSATVTDSQIEGNVITASDPNGSPAAFDSVADFGGPAVLANTTMRNNQVVATVHDTDSSGPDGGTVELDDTSSVTGLNASGNTVVLHATGAASAIGAVQVFSESDQPVVISSSLIRGNSVQATSDTGAVSVQGAGVLVDGLVDLRGDAILDNTGTAIGPSGSAQGGGIWEGAVFTDSPIGLTLEDTIVARNTLTGSQGVSAQGGGIYAAGFPVTLTGGNVVHNSPDQCVGLTC